MSDLVNTALKTLEDAGLTTVDRPSTDMPTLPDDITDLDDRGLMSLYAEFVAWSQYAAAQLACAKIDQRACGEQLKRLEAALVTSMRGEGTSATEARASALVHPSVLRANRAVMAADALVDLTEAIQTNLDKSAALLSRELTRRTSAERTRRQNWTT